MTVSPKSFPPRRRRPSATSFLSPNLSTLDLLRSLNSLSLSISSLHPPPHHLFHRNSSSIIRKSNLLSLLFEEILLRYSSNDPLHPSAHLCFEEMYIVLLRIQTLIEDCSNGSKMWLLMQNHSISNTFRELTLDLWTLLEILPDKDLGLSDDVRELKDFVIKQCRREGEAAFVEPKNENTRVEVLNMLDSIKRGIVPDHSRLSHIFHELGLSDSVSCRDEIEYLQDELQSQTEDNFKSDLTALIGLVRYAKCVLFGASSPDSSSELLRRDNSSVMNSLPSDFRCPITLDLMTDPVVVATGQTYDRSSITLWLESGHNTCPKTGQTLDHTNLIPNRALKNLIGLWCREQKIPYVITDLVNEGIGDGGVRLNKTALEATKMTVSFLVNKLVSGSNSAVDGLNRLVYELRVLAKTDSDSRCCIGEAGAIPLLVRFLTSDDPNLQVNAVTTVLNLSILEENKKRIMETDGALSGVIEVLRSGAIWEAKGNAAATIFSLSGVHSYRKKLGRKSRVVKGLLDLARDGPAGTKRDALVAILSLAGDRESVGRFVEHGVMDVIKELLDELPDEAATVLELIVKRGGLMAVAAAVHMIGKLLAILRTGTSAARESTVATLVMICRKGGEDMVAQLARNTTIEVAIWELMGSGTARAKRKAASLMRMIQRWAAGLEGDALEAYSVTIALP